MTEPDRSSTSPAVIAFVSGGVSTVLTVAATLVSLRADATRSDLFLVLTWVMFVAAAATVIALMWTVSTTLRQRLGELRLVRDIEAHISRNIRVRKRSDRLEFGPDGRAKYIVEWDVEADPAASVPWLASPFFGTAPDHAPPWQSVRLVRLLVDDVEYDVQRSFVKRRRSRIEGNELFRGLVCEEGVVRIPVSLDKGRTRCRVQMDAEFYQAAGLLDEDSFSVDISYITDEYDLRISGRDGVEIFLSPQANHPVEASQNSGELIDNHESSLQSRTCHSKAGIRWHSTSVKLGYRYDIRFACKRTAVA